MSDDDREENDEETSTKIDESTERAKRFSSGPEEVQEKPDGTLGI